MSHLNFQAKTDLSAILFKSLHFPAKKVTISYVYFWHAKKHVFFRLFFCLTDSATTTGNLFLVNSYCNFWTLSIVRSFNSGLEKKNLDLYRHLSN